MLRTSSVVLLSLLLLATGCGRMMRYEGTATHSCEWSSAKNKLGPTVLLVTTSPNPDLVGGIGKRLANHKGLQIVATRPAPCITDDAEIIRVSKKAHAQTAVVLCVGEWGYKAELASHGQAKYELRVVDVNTGKELMRAEQTCQAYGRTQAEFNNTAGAELIGWSMVELFSKEQPTFWRHPS